VDINLWSKAVLYFQFFDVAEVAIIHKKIHPDLVRKYV